MADDLLTLSDVIADAQDLSDAEVSDLEQSAPFVGMLPAEEASDGTTHKYTKEVGAPVVGFRQINAGRDLDHSEDQLVSADLEILDYSWKVDKALADKRRGQNRGREWMIAREGNRHRNAALFKYEQQVIKGQAGADATGFEGFADQTALASVAGAMVINAGGSTANATCSVYAVRVGPNDVMGVFNGDEPVNHGDTETIEAKDATGKSYPAYYTPGCTWLGLQVGAAKSIARLANLDLAKSGGQFTNGLTDDLIAELLTLAPSGRPFTHLLVSRYARLQVQQSRTATTQDGRPAPMPSESHGVPFVTTDALLFNEPVLA